MATTARGSKRKKAKGGGGSGSSITEDKEEEVVVGSNLSHQSTTKPRRSTRTTAAAAAVRLEEIKQEEEQQQRPAGKRRRASAVTSTTVTTATAIIKEEEEGAAASTSAMRVSRVAAAAAAAATATTTTTITAFDALPTLAPAGLFVGCSGCSYPHWHASPPARPRNFYPFRATSHEFPHYAAHFDALEINYTFYRLPSPETCARWRAQAEQAFAAAAPQSSSSPTTTTTTPPAPRFLYSLKAHRYFTHTKRARVDAWFRRKWEVAFWPRCQDLGPYLGPVLFQFPKAFRRTPETLRRLDDLGGYLAAQCPGGRFAVEFRHPSWFDADGRREAFPILQRHQLCLCGIHLLNPDADADADADAAAETTNSSSNWGALRSGAHPPLDAYPAAGCDWGVYLRFHGDHSRGSYGPAALEPWAAAIWRWRTEGLPLPASAAAQASPRRAVFAFFNNDATMDTSGEPGLPSAVADARRLGQLLARRLEEEEGLRPQEEEGAAAGGGAAAMVVVKKEEGE